MRKVFITGGVGFIGCNVADFYMRQGAEIILFDNLSRPGVQHNLDWLNGRGKVTFVKGDVRDYGALRDILQKNPDITDIFHEAAQVAVTTSVTDPVEDFNINALGTLNVLEAFRRYVPAAVFIYPSTNKVYGSLESLDVAEGERRYEFTSPEVKNGVHERHPADFYSPYGCSKGTADQYVRDYARIYNLKTLVFRQSCIYGTQQYGIEDQGWVAWFIIRALFEKPLVLYGTGKQVRDVLFVDDLVQAYEAAIQNISKTRGKIYNMGGGTGNSISLLEFISFLEKTLGKKITYQFADWRHGDQKIFIADTSAAQKDFGWAPKMGHEEGILKLCNWLKEKESVLRGIYKDIN